MTSSETSSPKTEALPHRVPHPEQLELHEKYHVSEVVQQTPPERLQQLAVQVEQYRQEALLESQQKASSLRSMRPLRRLGRFVSRILVPGETVEQPGSIFAEPISPASRAQAPQPETPEANSPQKTVASRRGRRLIGAVLVAATLVGGLAAAWGSRQQEAGPASGSLPAATAGQVPLTEETTVAATPSPEMQQLIAANPSAYAELKQQNVSDQAIQQSFTAYISWAANFDRQNPGLSVEQKQAQWDYFFTVSQ